MSTQTTSTTPVHPPDAAATAAESAGVGTPERLPRSTIALLAPLLVGAFVVILNETAMNVALSRIMVDLAVTERTAQWLTTGFMLTMAVVIPTTGWLLKRLNTRAVFALAMSLFSAGTLIAALSFAFPVLLLGRVVQACGTAVMMPLLMTTVMEVVPGHMRGRVMGTITLVIACAPAVGPTLSGLILQFFAWRFVFVMVLPIALALLALGLRLVPVVEPGRNSSLDLVSLPLVALGFGGLVYGLSLVGNPDAPAWELPTVLVVGVVALLAFGWRQLVLQRTDNALLDLRTFRVAEFSLSVVVMALAMLVLFGSIIATPLVLQQVLHSPPLAVGLLLLPGGLLMGLLGPVVGRLYDRVGPRWLVVPGGVAVAVSFAIFATISPQTQWWLLLIANLVLSAGLAFMMTPLFTVALGSLPHHLISYGSAVVGTVQQVAGAAGTALFVTIMSTVAAASTGTPEETLATGARVAFLAAGAVWLLAIVGGFFLRRPADEASVPAVH